MSGPHNQSEKDEIILDAKVKQKVDLNVETTNTDTDVRNTMRSDSTKIEVDAPKYSNVHVDIKNKSKHEETVTRTETTSDTTTINFTENMNKNIDISVWNVEVDVKASSIIQNSTVHADQDVNDLDTSRLINVSRGGELSMDDFNLDMTAIGDSFNGAGNDGQVSLNQSNDLNDDDKVAGTSVTYSNHQKPNISASLDASHDSSHSASGGSESEWEWAKTHGHGGKTDGKSGKDWGKPQPADESASGSSSYWWDYAASYAATLAADLSIEAPTEAFQTVTADGGSATAGDGIGKAKIDDAASDNEGDGTVAGDASATADALADAEAFTSEIMAGGNQQANFATLNVVGGNSLDAGDIGKYRPGHDGEEDGGHGGYGGKGGLAVRDSYVGLDDDLNDLDTSGLINVDGKLTMEDFDLDMDAIASSFNGPGNDLAFDVNQTNDLMDNDQVYGTHVGYYGGGWNGPFQSVSAYGGTAESGSGIGSVYGSGIANSNGGNGSLLGSTAASADAIATAQAFTSNIVVGANLQVNNLSATIVGGDSSQVDDIGLGGV